MSLEERVALERRLNRFGLSALPIAQTTDKTAVEEHWHRIHQIVATSLEGYRRA